ncbi:MAG: YggS family pyridoxal phosphate-dependent enzyme [Armatimonadota bacterium]
MAGIAKRLLDIRRRIDQASETVHRDPSEVTLIAVSKTYPVDAIKEAYEAGQRDFGESRWQELKPKMESLPNDIRWHFIGKLQSNKAKAVAASGCIIHTLESETQLTEIAKLPTVVDAFTEVNLTQESQKSGVLLNSLDTFIRLVSQCDRVRCIGLMTIGSVHDTPEQCRLVFRRLKEEAQKRGLSKVSMGMSADFEMAVQEGSTHVRVGTAVFGERS